jgi:hypothetical protein
VINLEEGKIASKVGLLIPFDKIYRPIRIEKDYMGSEYLKMLVLSPHVKTLKNEEVILIS